MGLFFLLISTLPIPAPIEVRMQLMSRKISVNQGTPLLRKK